MSDPLGKLGSAAKTLAPVHPGKVLAEDFMAPVGLTANQLALSLRIPANRITAIIAGKRGITADTALRLARYFGTSAEVWMGLQADYDLQTDREKADILRTDQCGAISLTVGSPTTMMLRCASL